MQYVDVNKSDKVLVYQLPKGTCLLNDWHVLKNRKMYDLKPGRMYSYGRSKCGFYKKKSCKTRRYILEFWNLNVCAWF